MAVADSGHSICGRDADDGIDLRVRPLEPARSMADGPLDGRSGVSGADTNDPQAFNRFALPACRVILCLLVFRRILHGHAVALRPRGRW